MKRTLVFILISVGVCSSHAQEPSNANPLRLIPAGRYIRGRHPSMEKAFNYDHAHVRWRELQPHPVRITKPFYVSAHEITVGHFRDFVNATGYTTSAEKGDSPSVGFKYAKDERGAAYVQPFHRDAAFTWKNPGFEQSDDHPVVCVSWNDTQEFCKWLSGKDGHAYRLPTEAEWEYACRAGSEKAFWWGNDYRGSVHQRANIANVELEKSYEDLGVRHWFIDVNDPGDGHVFTAPVGSFPANAFGVHDTHGNVWEWCHDKYVATTYRKFQPTERGMAMTPVVDPLCDEQWNKFGQWRVIRGGSWYNAPAASRSDLREYYEAGQSACYLGFRIARDASSDESQAALEDWQLEQQATKKVVALTKVFGYAGAGGLKRRAAFDSKPSADVTRHMSRISFLNAVDAHSLDAESVEHIGQISGLKALTISHVDNLTDADLAPIAKLKSLTSLKLRYGNSNLTNDCIVHLAALPNLELLELGGTSITDEGLVQFSNLKKLRTLNLSRTGTKGGILNSLGVVPLQSLALGDLTDEHATRLTDLKQLRGLSCNGPSLTGRGFAYFSALTQLTSLDLHGASGIGAAGFGPLRSLQHLTSLDLRGTQAGDDAMSQLSDHYQLLHLQISSDNLTDEGLIQICDVISLETLTVESPKLTDAGLRDFWRLNRLRTLNLYASKGITGVGASTLAEAKNLYALNIRSASLTDQTMHYISMMPALRRLTVSGSGSNGPASLTDRGILMLSDSTSLKSLEISLRNTQITDAAFENLKQANPDLQVKVSR